MLDKENIQKFQLCVKSVYPPSKHTIVRCSICPHSPWISTTHALHAHILIQLINKRLSSMKVIIVRLPGFPRNCCYQSSIWCCCKDYVRLLGRSGDKLYYKHTNTKDRKWNKKQENYTAWWRYCESAEQRGDNVSTITLHAYVLIVAHPRLNWQWLVVGGG